MKAAVKFVLLIAVAGFWGLAVWAVAHALTWWTFELAYFGFFILYGAATGFVREFRKEMKKAKVRKMIFR